MIPLVSFDMTFLFTKARYTNVFHIVWNNPNEPLQCDLITLIEQYVSITVLHQENSTEKQMVLL
jgi:hypothetical protein